MAGTVNIPDPATLPTRAACYAALALAQANFRSPGVLAHGGMASYGGRIHSRLCELGSPPPAVDVYPPEATPGHGELDYCTEENPCGISVCAQCEGSTATCGPYTSQTETSGGPC